ncbi:PHP domain-containing protein [Haliangium ochraceum]|uniref:PHP domain protein n=1 Tax=Haliangium ochraceum (strain DSM 14365 / JCM 11303 / SMP-2) TaxID=502025 RepID=D0LXH9_HALO1|nr:PHP domain-containing protein [Haliangium ochraceum]ACY17734.1 PHP domain protein [Haliangium ochraceum DSM 14365]
MRIELHCHSSCSDGSEAPEAVAAMARSSELDLFCLTDHDTCAGYEATQAACPVVLRGLELSCQEEGRTVHLLMYDVTGDQARWHELARYLEHAHEARRQRLRAMAERLGELGAPVDVESILAGASERTVGRPDLAQALVDSGAVSSFGEAFTRFLGDNAPAHIPSSRLSLADGLALGRAAGTRMSLAHPHTLGEYAALLFSRYRRAGLEGIEAYYGPYTARQRRRWLRLAEQFDLVVTGGSDFHRPSTPQPTELGIELPETHSARLREWLGL